MDRVVVLGGSGFLGSHVVDALLSEGYQVCVYDCCEPKDWCRAQEVVVGDLLDRELLEKTIKNSVAVYNFAGIADIDEAQNKPIDVVNVNILGNTYALEAAQKAEVKQFIFASSLYVFSQMGSFYRASKQSSEHIIEAYQERYGMNYTILRYGTLYGRRSDDRNSVYRYLKQALVNKCIVYHGNRQAMREYIHVEDAAKLSVKVLSPEYYNRHIMLTGQEKMKVDELFNMIVEILNEEVEIKYAEPKQLGHYVMTPYSFKPKLGHKLVANDYVDLGQGLLDCLSELHENHVGGLD